MDMYSDEDLSDTDVLLQKAFAKGDLKPGIVVLNRRGGGDEDGDEGGVGEASSENGKQPDINKIEQLQAKVKEIKLPAKFAWIERLDIVNDLAPLAPEIAFQLDDHRERREKDIKAISTKKKKKSTAGLPVLKSIEDDPIHNDFKREMNFYRQAQQAILQCLPRLKAMKVPTKRPDDYFAEMAKSDQHMQKVAAVLQKKQTATERSEKVRKIREQKKFAKQTQVQAIQDKHKAKREMLNSVKKFKEGQKNALDFLDDDDDKAAASKKKERKAEVAATRGVRGGRINYKRQGKDEKYGYGGKRRGAKYNTKDSVDDFDDARGRGGFSRGRGGGRDSSRGRGSFSGGRGSDRSSSRGRGSFSGGRGSDRSSSRGRGSFSGGRGSDRSSSRGRGSFSGGKGSDRSSSRGRGSFSGGRGSDRSSSRGRGSFSGGRGSDRDSSRGRGSDRGSSRGRGGFSRERGGGRGSSRGRGGFSRGGRGRGSPRGRGRGSF